MRRFIPFLFLGLITFILTSCSTQTDTPTAVIQSPSMTPVPVTPTPTPTTELTPTPTEEPLPVRVPHLESGDSVTIQEVHMIDETTGWGIGGTTDAWDHVLRTTDGGETWTDITPPEPPSLRADEQANAHGAFLDGQNAWIRYLDSTIIWRTGDAGNTWHASEPLDTEIHMPYYLFPNFMQFVDAQHGWVMIYLESGMSHDYVDLFRTEDGGVVWEKIVDPMENMDLSSCCKTGMAFLDTQHGLVTYEMGPYPDPYVTWTSDGGVSWVFQDLPAPPSDIDIADHGYCHSHSPNVFPPSTVVIAVSCNIAPSTELEQWDHGLYLTNDYGENWTILPYPGGALMLIDPQFGWALGREIHQTSDGGQTWELISSLDWDGQFSFVDVENGWAVARLDDEIAFVDSLDGGRSWNLLNPIISP
ncbi:MAG: hypothetical protein GTO18_21080 [Anaerolineales bacterium]|nr:hypothetical protein [Anaerolineales bacterium]